MASNFLAAGTTVSCREGKREIGKSKFKDVEDMHAALGIELD